MYTLNKKPIAFEELCYLHQCIRGLTMFCITSSKKTSLFIYVTLDGIHHIVLG